LNYPNRDTSPVECVWQIVAPLGSSVELNVVEYDSVGSDGSDDESLSVFSGEDMVSMDMSISIFV